MLWITGCGPEPKRRSVQHQPSVLRDLLSNVIVKAVEQRFEVSVDSTELVRAVTLLSDRRPGADVIILLGKFAQTVRGCKRPHGAGRVDAGLFLSGERCPFRQHDGLVLVSGDDRIVHSA